MPKLKRLSAAEVVSVLQRFGFSVHTQRGSHLKLRRVGSAGEKQTLTIPNHRELDTGTCHASLDRLLVTLRPKTSDRSFIPISRVNVFRCSYPFRISHEQDFPYR